MIDIKRLIHAADMLRNLASRPANHDAEKLLAVANELDQFRYELPSFVEFTQSLLSQYTPKRQL